MLSGFWNKIVAYLQRPVRIEPLVVFRIVFGSMMLFSTLRFIWLGWIDKHLIVPKVHFYYYGFSWVTPFAPWAMYLVHVLMVLGALGILLGWYYRYAAALFFITFTYCQLIDLTYYLNHYYFVSLVSLWMIFLPAHRYFSADAYQNRVATCLFIPAWTRDLVMLQMGMVYFFAGIAKINYDWLINALPLKIWLPPHYDMPLIGFLFRYKVTPYLFSWVGMLYDISIPFLLLYRKTRPWAYLSVLVFHALTGLLFQIGIFPLVMMSGTLMFFSDGFHQRMLEGIKKGITAMGIRLKEPLVLVRNYTFPATRNNLILSLVLVYVFVQLLFPFRYLLYPGKLFWTEEGYRFSWRVMLMEKAGTATFYVKDKRTGREGAVVNSDFLNAHQEKQMAMQPDMILQFAHYLADYYEEQGVVEPEVRAEVYVTLNARPSRLLIDPTVDLSKIEDGWRPKKWITNWEENADLQDSPPGVH